MDCCNMMRMLVLVGLVFGVLKAESPKETDIFEIEAEQSVLSDKLVQNEVKRDSLMRSLTELHLMRSGSDFPDEPGSFGKDPREKSWKGDVPHDSELEKTKALLITRIDSLTIEIERVKNKIGKNRLRIQQQLKGGKP